MPNSNEAPPQTDEAWYNDCDIAPNASQAMMGQGQEGKPSGVVPIAPGLKCFRRDGGWLLRIGPSK
jgi:hypothetical protein